MRSKPSMEEEVASEMPASITELQPIIEEFVGRLKVIENEISLLGEDKKALLEEYTGKLDIKTLKQAMRAVELKKKVSRKDTFDTFVEVLDRME